MARNREIDSGHIDEGTLHAWLDGALTPEESARVEAHVRSCAECGAAAAEARGLVAAASRILTALDDVPGGVAPGGPRAGGVSSASRFGASTARRRWTGWPLRVAAAVLFVTVGSFAVIQQMSGPRSFKVESTPRVTVAPSTPSAPSAPPPAAKKDQSAERKRDVQARNPAPAASMAEPARAPEVAAQSLGAHADSLASTPRAVAIAGRVVDAKTGQPVEGAVVHLSNPPIATATNMNGDYALPLAANQATGQPTQLTVRRIGFESKIDSVTLAEAASADTLRRDIALAENTTQLDQVVVAATPERQPAPKLSSARASAAPADNRVAPRPRTPSAPGCYTINAPGLPSRIEIGEHLRVLPPDSAAFPTAYWSPVGSTKVRIVFGDTSGTKHEVDAFVLSRGLSGSVTRSDSASAVRPFSATWTAPRCP